MRDLALTTEGRQPLHDQAARLRHSVLPDLLEAFADPGRDGEVVLDYERTVAELRRLEALLASTGRLEDTPDNPYVVESGDLVTLEIDTGGIERLLLIDPAEAGEDDLRVSVRSPLAQALLGRHVGDVVDLAGPTGSYRCRVLGATRPVSD